MNKFFKTFILCLFFLCGKLVQAQTTQSSEALRVWMDNVTLTANGEAITYIPVYEHDDATAYTGFNMSLIVPQGVRVATVKSGRGTRNAIDLSVRAAETHSISCNMPTDTQIKIICTSSQNDEFFPDDEEGTLVDELFKIGLVADPSTVNGTYTVTTEGVDFVLKPGTSAVPAYAPASQPSFQLTIEGGTTGIKGNKVSAASEDCYDLLGRRVQTKPAGIYIREGKKMLEK